MNVAPWHEGFWFWFLIWFLFIYLFLKKKSIDVFKVSGFILETHFFLFFGGNGGFLSLSKIILFPPPLPTCKKLNHYFLIVNRNWNHKNLETKSRYKILKIYTTSLCKRFNRINSKILHHLDSVFEVAILTWGDARAMVVIFTFQNPSLFFVLVRSSQFSYSNLAQELTSD